MEPVKLHYDISGTDFTTAGEASGKIKKTLKSLGFSPAVIRNVTIAVYEAEINMVVHAGGGVIDAFVYPEKIEVVLEDHGPGIPDIGLAMQEGWSTAPENVRQLGFGAGMGLPNIKKYSDDLQIESEVGKGTTIRITVLNK